MTRQQILIAIKNALIVMRDEADRLDAEADEMRDISKQIRLRGRELQDVYSELAAPNKWDRT